MSKTGLEKYYTYNNLPLWLYVQIVNTGNYRLISKGKITNLHTCLLKWENITAQISKQDGGKYDGTLENSVIYLQLQADLITIKSCLSKLLLLFPFTDSFAINTLSNLGYSVNTANEKLYMESIAVIDRKSNNLLNKIRSMELRLTKVLDKVTERKQVSIGEMISTVNVTLGSTYVTADTPIELYFDYKSMAKKKIDLLNKKANG